MCINSICIIYVLCVISLYSPIWEDRRKIVTGERSLQSATKKEKASYFLGYICLKPKDLHHLEC